MNIVFMGTPDFSVPILTALVESGHQVGYVVTQPDKAKDRGKKIQYTPVKEKALEYGIKVLQPERVKGNEKLIETLRNYAPDIIVVVAYGQILPEELIDMPKHGCVNVHASLLPKLRGASPIQHAIISGETETGITIMQMDVGLDTGDMLLKDSLEIGKMNYSQLHDKLSQMGARLIIEALELIETGKINPQPQIDELSSYAGMISKKDGKVDFNKSPEEVERLIRGFDPWPGAFCQYGDAVMKFWKAEPLKESTEGVKAGTVLDVSDAGIKVACGGRTIMITEIQLPGKKRVSVKDYLRGNKIEKGIILK